MALETVPAEEWIDQVKRRTSALPVDFGDYVGRFELTSASLPLEDIAARYHVGDLRVEGNFQPESLITAVDGDLIVGGLISTQGGDGADGNATLIVFGDVLCKTLINEWGSIIIVTGDLIVDEWVYAGREDSSLIVGGNFKSPIYIGADIGVTVGGAVEAEYAYGYATNLPEPGQTYGASKPMENRSWREIVARLGLGREVMAEEGLMQALDMRVMTTGSLLPR